MSLLAPFLLGILLAGTSLEAGAAESKEMQPVAGNVVAPHTQFSDGKRAISLSTFAGKYVLVNFWATWCAPCVREMPALDRLAAKLEKRGIVVVAISQDETGPTQVRPFVDKLKLSKVKILYDTDKRGYRDYALRGLPTTVLISPQGKLLARLEGSAAWDEGALIKQVERLTKQ